MRAIELWRIGPRPQTRNGHEPDAAPVPRRRDDGIRAAFKRARDERTRADLRQPRSRDEGDPSRANRTAFLGLESEREAVAARLGHRQWRPSARYRDLVLITRLVRLEYDHLVGNATPASTPPLRPAAPPGPDADTLADWAKSWGVGPMLGLRDALDYYQHRRDRLARWLSSPIRASAADDAERQWAA